MNFKIGKLKITAVFICSLLTAGTITYANNYEYTTVTAKTISDLQDEMDANDKEIENLEGEINDINKDLENAEYEQSLIQKKIDKQTENLSIIETKIDSIETQISDTEKKISDLEKDIEQKEKDIDVGLEHFKERLLAMYVSGNDSLASALVGSTDFFDMLSKVELISQVSKYDNELVTSLQTQLEQYEESKILLDSTKQDLNDSLTEQQSYQAEFKDAITELNNEYKESQDYQDKLNAEKNSKQKNIEQYEKDSAAKQSEIDKINDIILQQQNQQEEEPEEENNSNNNYNSDSNNDDDDDNNNSTSQSGTTNTSTGSGDFNGSLTWPVPGHYVISSGYEYRWGSFHQGIDISDGNTMGAAIVAADSGTVSYVATGCTHNYGKDGSCGCNGGYGNYVLIDHGNGVSTWYAHCSEIYVSPGQSVSRSETIGTAGSTGWSTGAHLHFEVRINGTAVNPTDYLY